MRALLIAAALATLAGCTATKEMQVRSALTNAGLPEPMAICMAEPLARDLSVEQLRSLSRVSKLAETRATNLSERQILDMLKRDLDPKTVGVVLRAGLGCILRG